jgi:hypothetical protein
MPKDVNIDEEDATVCGRYLVPFLLIIVITLWVEQYWESMELNQQVALVLLLLLGATFVYKNQIREMIYD